MRDYAGYRLHLALKRLVTGLLRLGLSLGVRWRPARRPERVTGAVVLLDRCLGLGDVLMISPALRRLEALGPVTVVTALPPLLEWDGEWRRCAGWSEMVAAVDVLARAGRLTLVPRLGVGGLLNLLAWPGGVPAGVVWLDPDHWLDTTSGDHGPISGGHYTDGPLACAEALRRMAGLPAGDQAAVAAAPPPARLAPRLPPGSATATVAALGLTGRRLVALAPWATSRIRRWPLAHWRALIERLAAARPDTAFLLLGSADERPAGDEIMAGLSAGPAVINVSGGPAVINPSAGPAGVNTSGGPVVVNLMGRLSLTETTAAIAGSALLVACDNGLMHLGLGTGTPLVAVFGSTDPAARLCGHRWRLAWRPELCPRRRAPCYPDLHRDPSCPTAIECLADLAPEQVAALALELLESEGNANP
jgi:hypothetical protein